jgi:carbon monoxide dehydrogenase subunit G
MASATAELAMTSTPEAVWAVVREFYDLASWMPGIESCEADGDERVLATMGMTIRERLVSSDDAKRTLTYSITAGAPVESHEATITVHDGEGGGSRVTWSVDAKPDEMAELMLGVYQQSLEALKNQAGG